MRSTVYSGRGRYWQLPGIVSGRRTTWTVERAWNRTKKVERPLTLLLCSTRWVQSDQKCVLRYETIHGINAQVENAIAQNCRSCQIHPLKSPVDCHHKANTRGVSQSTAKDIIHRHHSPSSSIYYANVATYSQKYIYRRLTKKFSEDKNI